MKQCRECERNVLGRNIWCSLECAPPGFFRDGRLRPKPYRSDAVKHIVKIQKENKALKQKIETFEKILSELGVKGAIPSPDCR